MAILQPTPAGNVLLACHEWVILRRIIPWSLGLFVCLMVGLPGTLVFELPLPA